MKTFGDYRIVRELGRGGMGIVYEALEMPLERRVALKVLPPALVSDPRAKARFEREARITARLRHPNIVEIFSMGIEEETPYFAMELVEGKTLREVQALSTRHREVLERGARVEDWPSANLECLASWPEHTLSGRETRNLSREKEPLDAGSPPPRPEDSEEAPSGSMPGGGEPFGLDFRQIAETFACVADGLHHAHSAGVIHRDLKPGNLIFDGAGRLRILDFGLASMAGQQHLTLSRESIGTPLYMSPEQTQSGGSGVGPGTDIYSLGVTIYEVLAGRPPFVGKNLNQTLAQIASREPPALRSLKPRVPRDLETIVHKCLRKLPRDRYGTAEALAQDLRRYSRGEPIEARPYSTVERLLLSARRNKARTVVAAGVLLLLLCIAWLALSLDRQARVIKAAKYEEMVTSAVMRFQQGVLRKRVSPVVAPQGQYDSGLFVPQGSIFTSIAEFQAALSDSAVNPVQEAMTQLDVAVGLLPRKADAYYHKARGLVLLGRDPEALVQLGFALERDEDFVPARILRATLVEKLRGREGSASEREPVAGTSSEGWAEGWLRAHRAIVSGDWVKAEEAFGDLISLEVWGKEPYIGCSMETLLGRGNARLELRDFLGAIEDFAGARSRWPGQLEPPLLLGKAYLLSGQDAQAARTFAALFKGARDPDQVSLAIAGVLFSVQKPKEAFEWVGKVKEGSLRERSKAGFQVTLGNWAEAREAAQAALALQPDDALSHLWLGVALLLGSDKLPDAEEELRKASRLEPGNSMANIWLGDVLAKQGKLSGALEAYREASRRMSGNAWALISQGVTLERLGDLSGALTQYFLAFEAQPRLTAVYHHLDGVLRRSGKLTFDDRVTRFTRALERVIGAGPESPLLPDLLRTLCLMLAESPRPEDIARAVHFGSIAVERTRRAQPRMLAALAKARFLNGDRADAVLLGEEALRSPHATREQQAQLARFRKALSPTIVSLASAEAAIASLDRAAIIDEGAAWRFFRGKAEPSAGDLRWKEPVFDDSSWESGSSGFGYADADDATVLGDMWNKYSTVYIRGDFSLLDPARCGRLLLSVRVDDGFVAYLNGVEVMRAGVKPGREKIPFNGTADAVVSVEPPIPFERWLEPELLRRGRNVLAIQGLNASADSSDFSLIPVLTQELPPDPEKDLKFLAELRGAGQDPAILAYVEARSSQRRGEIAEAAARFADAARLAPAAPEPVLRRAECLRADGRPGEAEGVLRDALEGAFPAEGSLWESWFMTCSADLDLSPDQILGRFPQRVGSAGKEPRAGSEAYGDDLRWLLEQLRAGNLLRIRCGGGEYKGADGRVWGRDRFFVSGCRFGEQPWNPLGVGESPALEGEIAGTDDDPLYLSERWFPSEEIPPAGYRIPLPRGSYRVCLHFAEIFFKDEGRRVFDVFLEGKQVLSWYDPCRAGPATPDRKSFTIDVDDGVLDIVFQAQVEFPKISAIEVDAVR